MDGETRTEVAARVEEDTAMVSQREKLEQFQQLMNHIIGNAIGQAMRQNNEALSEEISRQVNDRMVQELEYMMRISDEKEEERFKALDETLRAHQKENKGKAEAAAARMPFFGRRDLDGVERNCNRTGKRRPQISGPPLQMLQKAASWPDHVPTSIPGATGHRGRMGNPVFQWLL